MREKITKEILKIKNNNLLLELPTGTGKTKISLEKVVSLGFKNHEILIVIPRLVLINSWKEEIKKWGYKINPTFVTYGSLYKMAGEWDIIVFDECHHLSERCREALTSFNIKYSILLSATVKPSLKDELSEVFNNLYFYKVKLREAIENEVLPDPVVVLCPLRLNNTRATEFYSINDKKPGYYKDYEYQFRWEPIRNKIKAKIHCTEQQYYDELSYKIMWWKKQYFRTKNKGVQAKWLQLAGERLKWLSDKKTNYVKALLRRFKDERVLVFCNSIEQAEEICSNNITSKNEESQLILNKFNSGKINHISACNMLNEGINLSNCKIGIYANLNSTETIIKQRTGRLLRHEEPIIIIPYYVGTRDEELVNKMLEDYNPALIKKV